MTVSTEVDHNEYTGNGVTTSFPYTFRIFKKSDLVVQVSDLNGNVTELVLDTGYKVTGAGTYSGGEVVLPSPLAAGWRITIERVLDVVQETDLRNQGKFFPEVHEDAFDYLTMLSWSALCGIVVGLLMGSSRALNAALGPLFSALYPLPKIAIFPILLMIFGPTELPKIIAVFITTFFIMQINTVSGVWAIDRKLLEAGAAYGATGLARFRHVVLPGAMPFVFSGLKTATGTAVVVVTAVEFTGATTTGLGYLIWNSWQLFIPEKLYVGLVVIGLIGALVTTILSRSEKLLLPWRRER